MRTLHEFEQYFQTTMRPQLEPFEARRKSICRAWIGFLAALGILLLGLLLAGTTMGLGGNVIGVGVIAGVLAAGLVWWLLTRGFVPEFKNQVIAEIVRFCDPNLRYSPSEFISREQFVESGIFRQRIDRYHGEDFVEGVVDKTAIRFSETHAEHKTETTDSKGEKNHDDTSERDP